MDVYERNAPDDTFGFGVVFSDETLEAVEAAEPATYAEIARHFARWAEIDVHYRGEVITSGGHGFSALSRRVLLDVLQRRADGLGVRLHFHTEAGPDQLAGADLDRRRRRRQQQRARPATPRPSALRSTSGARSTSGSAPTSCSTPSSSSSPRPSTASSRSTATRTATAMSTFIVETSEETWRRAGLDHAGDLRPGESDGDSIAFCEELFADVLDGHRLIGNNSKWINFVTVRNAAWRHGNVVLLGDAAHTAHFSIGSGTKLALEDAIGLAWAFRENPGDVPAALDAYEADRRPIVESTQRAAQGSLEWFEGIGRYVTQPPLLFAFNLLTRSRRITYGELQLRDPGFVADVDAAFARGRPARPPMFTPFKLRELELRNRVVVSPMDMYSSRDGTPGDFHLVHLGARGIGGAGLVMTEMICVSREGRITPGCGGLYADEHTQAWARIVDFVHANGDARIGAQIGHSGRKGSTKLMWEGEDEPLEERQLAAARPERAALPAGREPGAARDGPRRHGRGARAVRRLDAGRGGRRLRPPRAAHGPRLPALLVPVAADQPPHRRVRGRPGGTRPLPARGVRGVPCGLAGRAADVGADLRQRLGGRWLRRRPGRRAGRAAAARGLRHRRRLERTGLARPAAGVRAQLPDAVRRPHPQRGGDPDHRRRRHLQLRRRQHDRARRPRRSLRARAPAPLRPALDAARRRRPGLRRRRVGAAVRLRIAAAEHRQGRRHPQGAAAPLRRRCPKTTSARPPAGGRRCRA